jgi:hypothetical protein
MALRPGPRLGSTDRLLSTAEVAAFKRDGFVVKRWAGAQPRAAC